MAKEQRTVRTEFSFFSNSFYFDLAPRRRGFGIAHVRKVSESMFLDVDKESGRLLGIEVLRPAETIPGMINTRTFTRTYPKRGNVPLRTLIDVVNRLAAGASNDKEKEAANFVTGEVSDFIS